MTLHIVGGASITSKSYRVTRTRDRAIAVKECNFCANGKWYVDWAMALAGPLAGYAPTWWRDAIDCAIDNHIASIPVQQESEAAELLGEFYPDCDSVRFMADGSNPNECAVRLARAATGRKAIAFCGYHGYGTSFPHNPDANDLHIDERRGIPDVMWGYTRQFAWGDAEAVNKLKDVACIVVEVPPEDEQAETFLEVCRARAEKIGALFVLDDVVTGFRVAPGGAAERYRTKADLYCIGKALGNGMNVSALVGKHEVMDLLTQGVHYSATFNGYGLATGAALATLRWIRANKETLYPELYRRGELLKQGMNEALGGAARMVGNATRPILRDYSQEWLNAWRDKMYERGFYCMAAPWYVTMAHTNAVIERTIETCREVVKEMK